MIISMTGYGRSEAATETYSYVWEIKSVNGRYLDAKWRMPPTLRSLEQGFERILREYAGRGRVEVGLNLEVKDPELLGLTLNHAQVKAMLTQVNELAESMGDSFTPDYNRMLSMPGLWRDAGSEPDPTMAQGLADGLRTACKDWNESRKKEGEAMARDLLARVETLTGLAAAIKVRVPEILAARREDLLARIQEMVEAGNAQFSEDRMLQEVAVLTDKLDVSEELTRLDEHLKRLAEVLSRDGEQGKRLDFLLQETFREINTCGNKSQDSEASRLAVDFKAELEKCREQVQNIE